MNRKLSIILAGLMVAPLIFTGCQSKPTTTPKPDEITTPIRQVIDCEKLAIDECGSQKECRYLRYRKPTNPAKKGLCVAQEVPAKECFDVDDQYCELEGYIAKKCEINLGGGCRNFKEKKTKSLAELAALAAGWAAKSPADLDAELPEFWDSIRDIPKDDLAKLVADANLVNRLVSLPMRAKALDLLEKILEALKPETAKDEVNKKVAGKTAMMALLGAGRPAGDDPEKLRSAVGLVFGKGANLGGIPASEVEALMAAVNASASVERMNQIFNDLDKSADHTRAWLRFAVKKGTPEAKASVKAKIASADPALKSQLMSDLLAQAALADFDVGVGPKTKLEEMVTDPSDWFDKAFLNNPSINLAPESGLGAGPFPVALARFLRFKREAQLDRAADIAYLRRVIGTLKTSLTEPVFDALVADPVANDIASVIEGNADKQKFFANFVLQKEVAAVGFIWNAIKGLDLANPANVDTVSTYLQVVLDIADPAQRQDMLTKLLESPTNDVNGLQLIHRIVGEPLTPELAELFTKIFNALPLNDPGMTKKKWLEYPIGAAGGTLNGRFAIAYFFEKRPFPPQTDAANAFNDVTKLMSTVAADLNLTDPQSVVPVLWRRLYRMATSADGNRFEKFYSILERITKLSDGADGAEALRKLITAEIVKLKHKPGDTYGLIHKMFDNNFVTMDQRVADNFTKMLADLSPADRRDWVRQTDTTLKADGTPRNATVLSYMLRWGNLLAPTETILRDVLTAAITAGATPAAGDAAFIWATLATKRFETAHAGERNDALAILTRVVSIIDPAVRKPLTLGLVGGSGYLPKFYSGTQRYPGAFLIQTLALGPINDQVFAIYDRFISDNDVAARGTMLNRPAVAGVRSLVRTLTDGRVGAAGSRLGVPATLAVAPDAADPKLQALLGLIFTNGADLTSIEGANLDYARTHLLAQILFRNPAAPAAVALDANVALRERLLRDLLIAAAKVDIGQPLLANRTKLTGVIESLGDPNWFRAVDLKDAMNLTDDPATAGNPIMAIANWLRVQPPNAPLPPLGTPGNIQVDYLIKVNAALKAKLFVRYPGFAGGTTKADIANLIGPGTLAQRTGNAGLILQEAKAPAVWDLIKDKDFATAGNLPLIDNALNLIFNMPAANPGQVAAKNAQILLFVNQLPDAASGGLQLIHRIMESPLTPQTAGWFTDLWNGLNAGQRKLWLKQLTVAPHAAPQLTALQAFFLKRPTTPPLDDPNSYNAIAKLLADPTVTDNVMADGVADALWAKIVTIANVAANRLEILGLLKAITNLPDTNHPTGAENLRKAIEKRLFTRTTGAPPNAYGLIHILVGDAMLPVDVQLFTVFDRISRDLTDDERKLWLSQTFQNTTPLPWLLVKPVDAANTHLNQMIGVVAAANPTISRPNDVNSVWETLKTKSFFNNAAADQRPHALAILDRIRGIANDNVRKDFSIGLMGGTLAPIPSVPPGGPVVHPGGPVVAKTYDGGAGQVYPPNSILNQSLMLGDIDATVVNIYTRFLDDQGPSNTAAGRTARAAMVNSGTALPPAFVELTDWKGTTVGNNVMPGDFAPGGRLRNAGTGDYEVRGGDAPGAELAKLVRLLLENGVDLARINAGSAADRENRIMKLAELLRVNSPGAFPGTKYAEFIPLFEKLDSKNRGYLAKYAVVERKRQFVNKMLSAGSTLSDNDKKELQAQLFNQAMILDITAKAGVPPATAMPVVPGGGSAALTAGWAAFAAANIYDNLPKLVYVLDHHNEYGLPADYLTNPAIYRFNVVADPGMPVVYTGNLMWLLMRSIDVYNQTTALPTANLQGLVTTVATKIMPRIIIALPTVPNPWRTYLMVGETTLARSALQIVEQPAPWATNNATAKTWLGIP